MANALGWCCAYQIGTIVLFIVGCDLRKREQWASDRESTASVKPFLVHLRLFSFWHLRAPQLLAFAVHSIWGRHTMRNFRAHKIALRCDDEKRNAIAWLELTRPHTLTHTHTATAQTYLRCTNKACNDQNSEETLFINPKLYYWFILLPYTRLASSRLGTTQRIHRFISAHAIDAGSLYLSHHILLHTMCCRVPLSLYPAPACTVWCAICRQ